MNQPIIMAKTTEEFQTLSNAIKQLPEKVYNQIEKVENGFKITCHLKKIWADKKDVFLPDNCTQISDFGEYIGAYCVEFFLQIPKSDSHYSYIFIKNEKTNP